MYEGFVKEKDGPTNEKRWKNARYQCSSWDKQEVLTEMQIAPAKDGMDQIRESDRD